MSIVHAPESSSAVAVVDADLQGGRAIFCPNPKMPLWSNHPRVFIDVATTGEGKCPYCGTLYRLSGDRKSRGGH
jgi:uncharacterized Zn-finger protein